MFLFLHNPILQFPLFVLLELLLLFFVQGKTCHRSRSFAVDEGFPKEQPREKVLVPFGLGQPRVCSLPPREMCSLGQALCNRLKESVTNVTPARESMAVV